MCPTMRTVSTALWITAASRLREARERGSERGLTTTEVAVLTFILVAIAVVIGGLIYQYASDTVEGNPAPSDLAPTIPEG